MQDHTYEEDNDKARLENIISKQDLLLKEKESLLQDQKNIIQDKDMIINALQADNEELRLKVQKLLNELYGNKLLFDTSKSTHYLLSYDRCGDIFIRTTVLSPGLLW